MTESPTSQIRVRFAPSPTGYLHIGGVRTALFNFLYARNQGGVFLLRIEDTDQQRSQPEYEEEILSSMRWLGLNWDEELVYQSRRLDRYREAAAELLSRGLAFEEEKDGKKAVVFKMPRRKVLFHDIVHGPVEFDASLFEDLVIMKSDGFPTYHFAVVVDDHDMSVSHVIRGDDHLSNTPRQLLLYEAFGWKPPKYGHLPLIAGADGAPLSKRHGAVSVTHYRKEGYLPQGMLNYLALLGWGADANQEIFTLQELVKKFSLKKINKAQACFNPEKFLWINSQHLKAMPEEDYLKGTAAYYPEESAALGAENWRRLVLLYRTRIKTFRDLKTEAGYVFNAPGEYDAQLKESLLQDSAAASTLEAWSRDCAGALADFEDHETLDKKTREFCAGLGIAPKILIHPLRFILTGKTVSPGLFELMSVLGKSECQSRVSFFLKTLGRTAS